MAASGRGRGEGKNRVGENSPCASIYQRATARDPAPHPSAPASTEIKRLPKKPTRVGTLAVALVLRVLGTSVNLIGDSRQMARRISAIILLFLAISLLIAAPVLAFTPAGVTAVGRRCAAGDAGRLHTIADLPAFHTDTAAESRRRCSQCRVSRGRSRLTRPSWWTTIPAISSTI